MKKGEIPGGKRGGGGKREGGESKKIGKVFCLISSFFYYSFVLLMIKTAP